MPNPIRKTLDIFPTMGMVTSVPARELPIHASPDMLNVCVRNGMLVKRPGYAQFRSGNSALSGAPVLGLSSVQDEEDSTFLHAMTTTGVYRFNAGTDSWDALTGTALTGASDRLFSWEVSQNALVFCQGTDAVQKIDFSGTSYAVLNANCPPARYLTRAADRLVLAHTVESGSTKPFRIRRSVAGDHTDWTGVGSGFSDLTEFPYHLRGIRKFGSRIIAYTERSAWVGTRTGIAGAPISWDPILTEAGLYAPFTLAGKRNSHLLLGNDDVYEFDGAQFIPIDAAVRDSIYNTLNSGSLHRMFGITLTDVQEYILFLCTGSASTPNEIWVYNWGRGIWYRWIVAGDPTIACLHRVDNTRSWDAMSGTWDAFNVEWDSFALQSAARVLLTGDNNGKVYDWSPEYFSDADTEIEAYWTSKDFVAADVDPSFSGRHIGINNVLVSYAQQSAGFFLQIGFSVDGGDTWPVELTLSCAAGTGTSDARLDQQLVAARIRIRIRQTSGTSTFRIHSIHPNLEIKESVI